MANYQTLFFDLAAGDTATPWRRNLGTNSQGTRAIHGTLTSGDTITVQMTNERLEAEQQTLISNVSTANFAASPVQSSTVFNIGYDGNFRWVRVVKTGTNGAARGIVEG